MNMMMRLLRKNIENRFKYCIYLKRCEQLERCKKLKRYPYKKELEKPEIKIGITTSMTVDGAPSHRGSKADKQWYYDEHGNLIELKGR